MPGAIWTKWGRENHVIAHACRSVEADVGQRAHFGHPAAWRLTRSRPRRTDLAPHDALRRTIAARERLIRSATLWHQTASRARRGFSAPNVDPRPCRCPGSLA